MKKMLFLSIGLLILMSTGCKKVPVLESGEEVFMEIEGTQVTADMYYERLKEETGTGILVEYIDILVKKFYIFFLLCYNIFI